MLQLLIAISLIITTSANTQCSSESAPLVPKYYKMEKCQRSKLGIAAKANYTSLTSCQRLGIEKKALALNFVPPEALKEARKWKKEENGTEPLEYTCEVLKSTVVCLWSTTLDMTIIVSTLNQYVLNKLKAKKRKIKCMVSNRNCYARLVFKTIYLHKNNYQENKSCTDHFHVNSTCIPATGMFFLTSSKLNYTQARTACKNMSGLLADIANEQRTDALAQLLSGAGVDAAFVGLRRINGSAFKGTNGDSLDCTTYRAWAPGHPRRQRDKFDCTVVTRQKTWRSTSCKKKYPALCEMNLGGPYKRGSIFASLKPPNNTETTSAQNED